MGAVTTLVGVLRRVPPLSWPEESQLGSRRNALVAATALAEACRDQREVAEFLELHARRRADRFPSPRVARSAGET